MGNRVKLLLVDDELFLREQICANVLWKSFGIELIGSCFLKETGVKFSEYLLEIRMEKAKQMLKDVEDSRIEEVAEQIGLGHDVPYFYQLFKRYTGMTPKEYKKS